jgi:hypothetical protein
MLLTNRTIVERFRIEDVEDIVFLKESTAMICRMNRQGWAGLDKQSFRLLTAQ